MFCPQGECSQLGYGTTFKREPESKSDLAGGDANASSHWAYLQCIAIFLNGSETQNAFSGRLKLSIWRNEQKEALFVADGSNLHMIARYGEPVFFIFHTVDIAIRTK